MQETQAVKDVLIKARKLIENRENWWDGHSQHKQGKNCAITAIGKVCDAKYGIFHTTRHDEPCIALAEALQLDSAFRLTQWNDSSTHEEVLAGFDRAIQMTEERGL